MKQTVISFLLLSFWVTQTAAQEKVFPGADEQTLSKAQYFSWINNTNEGATEEHTRINFDFFAWQKANMVCILIFMLLMLGQLTVPGFTGF